MATAEDLDGRRRSLLRSRRITTVAVFVLIVVSLMWLAALADPDGDVVLGVIVLEAVTLAPLALVLRRRRRVTRQIKHPDAETAKTTVIAADPVLEPPPPLTFDPAIQPQLVLHPRWPFVLLALVGPVVVLLVMLKLSYDQAEFDPRVALLLPYAIVIGLSALRSRVLVVDGALWRRAAFGRVGIRLDQLAKVELRRARFLNQEGYLRTILRVADSEGRKIQIKPLLWTAGAKPLLAGLGIMARERGLALDERTARAVAQAVAAYGSESTWAYQRLVTNRTATGPAQRTPMRSTFWTQRDELGRATKLQLRRLLILPVFLLGGLPFGLVVGNVGTHGVRSLRCANDRSMWAQPGSYSGAIAPPGAIVGRLSDSGVRSGPVEMFTLAPRDVANRFNTKALQRDARTLAEGSLLQWSDADGLVGEVYLERFRTAEDAVTFHRDYAEEHCHGGDRAFATPGIAGGVGFRCRCKGKAVEDRVSFVRGDTRVQVIDWRLTRRDGHAAAITLAKAVLSEP